MNLWDILEIPSDSDVKTIKRAYAKLLKIHNPEDDPDGYQRIREAYDKAIKYAKKNSQKIIIEDVNNISINYENSKDDEKKQKVISDYEEYENRDNINSEDLQSDLINDENKKIRKVALNYREQKNQEHLHVQNVNININQQIDNFFYRLNNIYNNMSLRIDFKVWEELFDFDVVWNVYSSSILEDKLCEFLINHEYIPMKVWNLINKNFNYFIDEIKLYKKYNTQQVERFLQNLQKPNSLSYEFLSKIEINFADEYLYFRIIGDNGLKNKNYEIAKEYLFKAYDKFKDDPELLRLIGSYYYDYYDFDNSYKFFKSAFELNPNDLESSLYIGNILTREKKFKDAIIYLELSLSLYVDNVGLLLYMAYCCYYTEEYLKAKEFFSRVLSLENDNKIASKYLKNIESKLSGKKIFRLRFKESKSKKMILVNGKLEIKPNVFQKSLKIILKILNNIKGIIEAVIGDVKYGLIYIVIGLFILFLHMSHGSNSYVSNISKYNQSDENSKIINEIVNKSSNQNNKITDEENYNTINGTKDLEKLENNMNVKMYIKDIKATNYYKLTEHFDSKMIFSKNDIIKNNLNSKIESQLFVGVLDNKIIIFSNKKYIENTIVHKYGTYILKGTIDNLDKDTYRDLINELNGTYEYSGLHWESTNGYIDCIDVSMIK